MAFNKTGTRDTFKKVICFSLTLMLAGCKVYSTSFGCPNARGLACMSMSEVDKRISSGEIEEVGKNNCRGKPCAKNSRSETRPLLKVRRVLDAVEVTGGEHGDAVRAGGVIHVE